jgi:hypothetical protein
LRPLQKGHPPTALHRSEPLWNNRRVATPRTAEEIRELKGKAVRMASSLLDEYADLSGAPRRVRVNGRTYGIARAVANCSEPLLRIRFGLYPVLVVEGRVLSHYEPVRGLVKRYQLPTLEQLDAFHADYQKIRAAFEGIQN